MKNKLRVTIGIAALNAQENIQQILRSLLKQKETNLKIIKIIIHSDASTDQTVTIASEFPDKRIEVIDSKKRRGFAGSVEKIFEYCRSEDIVILLNDDIKIIDQDFIEKTISPFLLESNIGLVSGNPQPLNSQNFVEKAIISSFRAYEGMRYSIRSGHNAFTCDGKILAFSKPFIKSLRFTKNRNKMGNLDAYLYFYCIIKGFKYKHAKHAKAYFRSPNSVADYFSWTIRSNANFYLLKNHFGKIVEIEYRKPLVLFAYYKIVEFIKNPLGCIFIYFAGIYIQRKANKAEKWFTSKWETVQTTKNLMT